MIHLLLVVPLWLLSRSSTIVLFVVVVVVVVVVEAFHHNQCNDIQNGRKLRPQFQFDDCYIPPLDTNLLLSEASFLMSHDSATGYIDKCSITKMGTAAVAATATWRYTKNQVGDAYQQLNNGARALDLRPKLLSNGTVIFQHGEINIPVPFEKLVADAVNWCNDNPDELVLILSSDFAYQRRQQSTYNYYYYDDDNENNKNNKPAIVRAMDTIYKQFGIQYLHCTDVYQLTIGEIMDLAALPQEGGGRGGYLVALDGQDYYGTPCAKPNWVQDQLVGCYSTYENTTTFSCTSTNSGNKNSNKKLMALQSYMLASSNNPATDNKNTLGPPASTYTWPLFEIQAFWQVTTQSAVTGASHLSSILVDNEKSNLNSNLVTMIYQQQFDMISIFAIDNVALYGNAILSVLRTSCAQFNNEICGPHLAPPPLTYLHYDRLAYAALVILYSLTLLWVGYVMYVTIRDREVPHPRLLWTIFQRLRDSVVMKNSNGQENEDVVVVVVGVVGTTTTEMMDHDLSSKREQFLSSSEKKIINGTVVETPSIP